MNRVTKIGLCTDSNAQLPPDLVSRFDVEVVPITVVIDDHEYLEGVDIGADEFYAMFAGGHRPTVTTSQPSPGQFALAYEELVGRGCTEILSIHASAGHTVGASGTLNAARLGARGFDVPVRLVDSGTASFGIGCCVWAAGDAIADGACLDEAAAIAESLAPTIGNVFVVGALELGPSGAGRGELAADGAGLPVLALVDGQVQLVDRVATAGDAVQSMAATAARWGERLKVAIGVAHCGARALADSLHCAIASHPNIDEIVHYRVGPSVGVHTGPGTAGCFMFPAGLAPSTRAAS